VDQAEFDVQLKIWKDLAISKQMLIGAATDALGLDPECSMDDLKNALEQTIKRGIEADANITQAEERANAAIAAMEEKMAASDRAQALAEDAKAKAEVEQQRAELQLSEGRAANANELKKAKALVAEKDKALKAINTALADTPDNVIKKLKTLKKQKNDESNSRKRLEAESRTQRKEIKDLEQRVSGMEETLEKSAKLAEQYRELHARCAELHAKLSDADDLPALPELDEELLDSIANANPKAEKEKLASAA
jgi:chromosome segregation ATPase